MKKIVDLNGTWHVRWADGQRGGPVSRLLGAGADLSRSLEAQVPGEVHLDLMRAGLLAEPSEGLNCLAARWVEESLWLYRRTFEVPALSPGEHAYLVFEGLDLAAAIYLNGQEIGHHANAFYPCQIEISGQLRDGENVLVVVLDSGLFYAGDRPASGYGMSPDSALHKRNWLRKTQSSFGWDWSTRLINVGIHGNVYLEVCSDVHVESAVVLAGLSADLQHGNVTGRIFAEGLGTEAQDGTLTVTLKQGEVVAAEATTEVAVMPGPNRLEAVVSLDHPRLWWPVGHGEQPLYEATVTLTLDSGVVATRTRRIGFRHVNVNQAPHPDGGNYFVIEVNRKPIFAKGGNFVPADMILARLDRARYDTLVDRALEANYNLLRIWGGGLYESDHLYDLCDEKGLLVWQEFIFACAKYPAQDEAFLADVKREATLSSTPPGPPSQPGRMVRQQ